IIDENIFLAAKVWKIKYVDFESKKIEVIKTSDGKKPIFYGGGAIVHPRIREKMFEILYDKKEYDVLDQASSDEINKMRKNFSVYNIYDLHFDRPLFIEEKRLTLFSFSGTRINRSISFLMNLAGIKNLLDDSSSSFEIEVSKKEFIEKWHSIINPLSQIDSHIEQLLQEHPTLMDFSKWGICLPEKYKVNLLKQRYFDFSNIKEIDSYRFNENKE
ncbi:MAG: DEAD/DEAH box helicase, partial [Bacteroidota bacterium]